MSIPTTEIIIFDTAEAHRESISDALEPVFNIVCEAEGCRRPGYSGVQLENPATGYVFINWDSLAHHQAVINGPIFGSVVEGLNPVRKLGGEFNMYDVIFNDHPVALQYPVTEVAVFTLKDISRRAEALQILTTISEKMEKKLVFGPTLGDENVIILIAGWESIEAHRELVAEPKPKAMIEQLMSLVNLTHMFHTTLTAHTGK